MSFVQPEVLGLILLELLGNKLQKSSCSTATGPWTRTVSLLQESLSWALGPPTKPDVSTDHLRPTSTPRTTRRDLALLADPSPRRAPTRVVSTASWPPACNGSPSTTTSKRLPSAAGTPTIQNVGRNTTARFTAYSCHHAFQSVTPFVQNPCPRTLRGDDQKSRGDGHTGKNARLGEGTFARRRTTRNRCGSTLVRRQVGQIINANPAPGPPWDLTKTFTGSDIRGKNCVSGGPIQHVTRLRVATLVVRAQTPQWRACAPPLQLHAVGSKLITPSNDRTVPAASWRQGVSGCPSKLSQQLRCNVRMSDVDHWGNTWASIRVWKDVG